MSREPQLLSASSGELVAALVALVEAFPSRDVLAMVQGRPGLLLMQASGAPPARAGRAHARLSD